MALCAVCQYDTDTDFPICTACFKPQPDSFESLAIELIGATKRMIRATQKETEQANARAIEYKARHAAMMEAFRAVGQTRKDRK